MSSSSPNDDRAYTIFAQSMDRSGYARGTLSRKPVMQAEVPALDPRPLVGMRRYGHEHGCDAEHGKYAWQCSRAPWPICLAWLADGLCSSSTIQPNMGRASTCGCRCRDLSSMIQGSGYVIMDDVS